MTGPEKLRLVGAIVCAEDPGKSLSHEQAKLLADAARELIGALAKEEAMKSTIADLEKLIDAGDEYRDALRMVLLYHSGSPWDAEKQRRWQRWTGRDEATTRALCDQIRALLAKAP